MKEDELIGQDKQEKVLKWLEEKWPKEKRCCEICSAQNWSLAQHITAPVTLAKSNIQFGGASYPQIALICNSCGNTKFFNAVVLGIMEKKEEVNNE